MDSSDPIPSGGPPPIRGGEDSGAVAARERRLQEHAEEDQDAGIVNGVKTSGHGEAPNLKPYSVSESARMPLTRNAAFSRGRHLPPRERGQHRTGWLSPLDTQARILGGQAQNWPEAADRAAQFGGILRPIDCHCRKSGMPAQRGVLPDDRCADRRRPARRLRITESDRSRGLAISPDGFRRSKPKADSLGASGGNSQTSWRPVPGCGLRGWLSSFGRDFEARSRLPRARCCSRTESIPAEASGAMPTSLRTGAWSRGTSPDPSGRERFSP